MTCDEFRNRWLDGEPRDREDDGAHGDGSQHLDSCADCRVWERRQRALDEWIGAAIVVAPPPALVARLALLPRLAHLPRLAAAPRALPAYGALRLDADAIGAWVELLLLAFIGLAALAFTGFDVVASADSVLIRASDVLQAIPLLFNLPLLSYVASLSFTIVEAMATLILVALGLLQASPELFGLNQRTSAEN